MSFLFYSAWLIIRKYDVGGVDNRLQNLIKPFMIYVIYEATTLFPLHGGLRNPTVIIGNWIWAQAGWDNYKNY